MRKKRAVERAEAVNVLANLCELAPAIKASAKPWPAKLRSMTLKEIGLRKKQMLHDLAEAKKRNHLLNR